MHVFTKKMPKKFASMKKKYDLGRYSKTQKMRLGGRIFYGYNARFYAS